MKHDKLSHEKLVQLLEDRFDYLSARAVANELLAETETPKGSYEAPQLKKFVEYLEKHYSRVQDLVQLLKTSTEEPVAETQHAAAQASEIKKV